MAAIPETAQVQLAALHLPPFSGWLYKDAAEIVAAETPKWYGENHDFAELGDYWRKGDGYIGPTGTDSMKSTVLARIEPQFTPVDAIGDALDNVENALLKREPAIDLVPVGLVTEEPDGTQSDAQKRAEEVAKQEVDTLKDLIAGWWDARMFHQLLKQATRRSRWAERSYIRLWVPPGMLQTRVTATSSETVITGAGDLAAALGKIYAEAIPASRAAIYIDPKTQARASVMLYTLDEKNFAEVAWVDGDRTVIRILPESGDAAAAAEISAKMGGRLPLIECAASLLITEAVRREQKRLNYFESVLVRNVETAGFPERATINAEDEGEWEEVVAGADPGPYTVDTFNGKMYRLVPVPRTLGAAITANVRGLKQKDGTLLTPSVIRFDPIDPELTIKACDHAYRTLMRSCKQAHLANRGTSAAEASGTAYEQARAAFAADLDNTKGPVEGLTREALSALLALAEHIMGSPGEFTARYRVVVNLHVNAGPESPDALRVAMDAGAKRFLSRESVMARLGVEDPQAEIARIDSESDGSVPLQDSVAAVLVKLEQAGVLTPEVAAAMMNTAGMPVEDAAKLAEQIKAQLAAPAGTPGSGLGTGGVVPPIPGITG